MGVRRGCHKSINQSSLHVRAPNLRAQAERHHWPSPSTRDRMHTAQTAHRASPAHSQPDRMQMHNRAKALEVKESGAPREDRHGAPSSSTCRREQHRQRNHTRHRHSHCKTPHLHNTTGTHTQCTPATPRLQHPGAQVEHIQVRLLESHQQRRTQATQTCKHSSNTQDSTCLLYTSRRG